MACIQRSKRVCCVANDEDVRHWGHGPGCMRWVRLRSGADLKTTQDVDEACLCVYRRRREACKEGGVRALSCAEKLFPRLVDETRGKRRHTTSSAPTRRPSTVLSVRFPSRSSAERRSMREDRRTVAPSSLRPSIARINCKRIAQIKGVRRTCIVHPLSETGE
jgi:hypothetical protein